MRNGKVITVFSHKGGVGKTTLVHNVGSILADSGYKVLLIDADPQMNLTAAVAGMNISTNYTDSSRAWLDFLGSHTNLAKFIETAATDSDKLDTRFYIKPYKFKLGTKEFPFNNEGSLSLLPSVISSIDSANQLGTLPSIEFHLAGALALKGGFNVGIGAKVVKAIKELKKNFDYILIDTSPSASSLLNALLLFSGDYFTVPVKPDFFSVQAVDNLPDVFQNWSKLMSDWFKTANRDGLAYPRFLGVIPQMTKKHATPASRYAEHANDWNEHINKGIISFLRSYRQNYDSYTLSSTLDDESLWFRSVFAESEPFIIQECVHFTDKLRTLAEQATIPVCFLNDDICKSLIDGKNVRVELQKTNTTPDYQKTHSSILNEYTYIANSFCKL